MVEYGKKEILDIQGLEELRKNTSKLPYAYPFELLIPRSPAGIASVCQPMLCCCPP
jgi:hypothetical protein